MGHSGLDPKSRSTPINHEISDAFITFALLIGIINIK